MAKEYIEREAALEKVIEVKHHDPELSGVVLHRYIKEIDLKDIPAADVAPVRYGRWEKSEDDYCGLNLFQCSLCHEEWCFEIDDDVIDLNYHYCPNCGAKMDKEE